MEGESTSPVVIGRYELYDRIASGGMAAIHLGRLAGPVGFTRTVAVKRLHPQFAADPEFVTMFLDEARLAARIQHPNVVPTIDVVATGGELFLVMEYVRGESVSVLVRRAKQYHQRVPPRIVAAIVSGALQGLHAAHEAHDEGHKPLNIVHRDVSPQNILVGLDGTPRVLDFGVAKAEDKFHSTRGGEIKGKILYMSPEQLEGDTLDRTTDVYAMGLVLFELLTGERMFTKSQDTASLARILRNDLVLPSSVDPSLAPWDAIVQKASAKLPQDRFPTARAMAIAVERVGGGVASPVEVADYVERVAGDGIMVRTRRIAEIESGMRVGRDEVQAALATELARSAPNSTPDLEASARSERTEGSKVTLTLTDPKESPPRSRLWVAGVGFALVAIVGGAFAMGRAGAGATAAPLTPPTEAITAEPKRVETTTTPAVTAAPPATYSGVAATATVTVTTTATATAAVTAQPAQHATAVKPAASANKPSCDRPTFVDSAGHTHFRPECL